MPPDRSTTPSPRRASSGAATDPTYAGALSFMRRRYTKNVKGADAVVWGIPVRRRRHQPAGRALRAAGDPPRLGDLRQRPAISVPPRPVRRRSPSSTMATACSTAATTRRRRRRSSARRRSSLKSGAFLLSLGGDHFVTWPLLKAHAAIHGPLALVQFDAHQDTWDDDGKRIDHGSFVARAVREGIIDPDRSIQIGIRTHAPDDCGIKILYGHEVEEMRAADIAYAIVERTGGKQDLRHLRHRLPRPGLCAGHRHAGRRRAVLGQDAVGAAPARRRSTSSAPTWSRLRRPTIMPISRPSPGRRSRCTISACSPSERRGRTA